jgi:WD40 repeat protein
MKIRHLLAVVITASVCVQAVADEPTKGPTGTLGMPFLRHVNEYPSRLSVSPDGRLLLTGGPEYVCVFDRADGAMVACFKAATRASENRIREHLLATFMPDGTVLDVSPGLVRVLCTLDARHEMVRSFDVDKDAVRFALSSDGMWLAGATPNGNVSILDVRSGRRFAKFTIDKSEFLGDLAFSPDGRTLALTSGNTADERGTLWLLDLASGTKRSLSCGFPNDLAPYRTIVFSPHGELLVSVFEGLLHVVDPASASEIRSTSLSERPIRGLAVSPDGRHVAAGREDGVVVLDGVTLREERRLAAIDVRSVQFTPDGGTVIFAANGLIRAWDLAGDRTIVDGHDDAVTFLAFSPDGKTLASSDGRSVALWELASGRLARRIGGKRSWLFLRALLYSPEGMLLTSQGGGNPSLSVDVWNPATGGLVASLAHPLPEGEYDQLHAFSIDTKRCGTGSGSLLVLDVATGRTVARVGQGGGNFPLHGAAISPDGTTAAVACEECVLVYDLKHANVKRRLPVTSGTVLKIDYSPDGKRVAVYHFSSPGDQGVDLWDLQQERPVASLAGADNPVFSRQGRLGITRGKTIEIRSATGEVFEEIPLPSGATVLAFAPDGHTVAIGGPGGVVRTFPTR